jgi:hypothetical protein
METYANGMVEDEMISSLSFKIDPTANYVTSRQSVTYQAQGSNIYQSGSGSRVIRFQLSGTGQYLDPSTVRFMFTLVNNTDDANKILYPVGGPWSFFRRCRVYSGSGAVLEDIDMHNRIYEMMHLLTSKANRDNDCNIEGFGGYWDSDSAYNATFGSTGTFKEKLTTGIARGQSRTVSFKTLFGIFNQSKYLPLQWMPLTVEFELVSNATEPIATELTSSAFPPNTTSQTWLIQDCQIKADVVELDSQVHNEYASHLMQGHPIPINYTSYITQLQTVTGGDVNVNITRSCSRLKSIFISFDKNKNLATGDSRTLIKKPWNYFYHPLQLQYNGFDNANELQIQVLVGNKTFPVFPIRSAAEAYVQLKKSLGIHGSTFHSISIDSLTKYCSSHFIVGIDTEKVLGASFSGINCRQDLISINAKGVSGSLPAGSAPEQIYITLQPDYVVEIRESGVLVID